MSGSLDRVPKSVVKRLYRVQNELCDAHLYFEYLLLKFNSICFWRLGTQLIHRNDELALQYEKIKSCFACLANLMADQSGRGTVIVQ